MKLRFLGLGSAFNPDMKNTNAFFIEGEELYLLDCGESAFGRIWNSKALTGCSRVSVALTHFHCDHAGSLGSLVSYCAAVLKKPVRLIYPLETIKSLLALMGIAGGYTWLPSLESGTNGNVSFRPVAVKHVDNLCCFGYIISDSEKTIYYSGDSRFIPPDVIDAFYEGDVDEIYQDSAIDAGNHATHCSFKLLEETFAPEFRSRIYCIHLDRDYRETIRAAGFKVPEIL